MSLVETSKVSVLTGVDSHRVEHVHRGHPRELRHDRGREAPAADQSLLAAQGNWEYRAWVGLWRLLGSRLPLTKPSNLALSTILKLGRDRRQRDPLDYGPATMEMLLKDAVVRDFLDETEETMPVSSGPLCHADG